MKSLTAALMLTVMAAFAGDLILSTSDGHRVLKGDEAGETLRHWEWIRDRLKEAETIKKGSSYPDLKRHFVLDGGLQAPGQFRYGMILCPSFKVDVEFVAADGGKVAVLDIPDDARVSRISKLYVQHPFYD